MAALSISAGEILTTYRELAEIVVPSEITPEALRDPQDAIVLACAVGGNVDCIVSGDKDLLTLAAYEGIPILNASQFLDRLSAGLRRHIRQCERGRLLASTPQQRPL